MATMKLGFYGAAGGVTGSNFLLWNEDTRILIDCGLFQGEGAREKNRAPFPYNPAEIDVLFVTHPHLDHVGRIPRLVREGFRGVIYSTPPTRDIAQLILEDTLRIEQEEKEGTQVTKEDLKQAMALWKTVGYHKEMALGEELSAQFRVSGHVLGSAMVDITHHGKRIVFTGDLGNSPAPLLPDTEYIHDADYIIMESVYGDKTFPRKHRKDVLEDYIEETIGRGGALLIPAFSLERTQELLFEIKSMMASSKIPLVPVFVDSPLAIKIIDVYRRYADYFNERVTEMVSRGEKVFDFPQVHLTYTAEKSKGIRRFPNPKIIIASSGMSSGGRILHHEKTYLPESSTMLVISGYQAPGTLGRALQDGAKLVEIHGQDVPVNAHIKELFGYSSHRDADGLFDFVVHAADTVKKVFVVMGEPKTSMTFTQRLRDYLGVNAFAPQAGETVELEF